MGKNTDKLYITHSEWSSSDAYSASAGANVNGRPRPGSFRRLPFNFCAASLQPFKNPVCTKDGTIFDVEVINSWLEKHDTNPVDGEPLSAKDLIKLNFARNAGTDSRSAGLSDGQGDLIDPVTFKVFTDNTHIVAVRHGSYANVFAWETVERMNIKAKNWRDLVDDEEFTRADIITLQDPQNAASRDLSQFKFLKDGEEAILTKQQEEERKNGNVNIGALGRMGDKVLRAKEAVEKARKERGEGADVNRTSGAIVKSGSGVQRKPMVMEKKVPFNAAVYTTGRAAASFTSTGLTPETSGERALLTDEEYMLKPRRVKIKGYARIETNLGDLNIELYPEYAPRAVWNFTRLAQKGYYRGVTFHRNIRNFMLQGGDPSGTGKGGTSIWGKNFQDEFDGPLTHDARGIISMANKGKNTNSSQFFIIYRPTKHLDNKHTVFGKVVGGLDVLSKMEDVPTDGSDRPLNKIVMKEVVVYLDPFEEFLKEKTEIDKVEKTKQAIALSGGTEDDKTTWTGKRIRADGTVDNGSAGAGVGKYLKSQKNSETAADADLDTWEEPAKKKVKSTGFGNFDNW
ncbi:cyclophilin type peptidyl-prolyl cis-trans isomerase/CLD [Colletotrichum sublineola]|uniref:Peptidyl-prolyl cis-trans isomerase-like 2 n=1 Tax=Colletotrichum sublineola TaxID=1173701 RepID=A0A066XLK3_COLSU|nr:cyclophilin type peptidyl-prolyl cis-trans isomerase/CLD [Colletotrichum sublineola]KDN69782.1 putative cyclophilin type peptidyl-prolyl cis-trans isomerase/CLD [Colletotrichum sublineola]